jgi:hypothetical protein
MTVKELLERYAKGERDFFKADLCRADLRRANLRGADLCRADLRGADLDYSVWPLRCGSLDVKVNRRIAAQLAYHFCRLDCADPGYLRARNALAPFANTFHRADECGAIRPAGAPEAAES